MFKLMLDEEKEFLIKNTTLKGTKSIVILSLINDYKNTCEPDFKSKLNESKALKVFKKYNIDLTNSETEEGQKVLKEAFLKNPDLAIELYGSNGDSRILFEVITEILEYYQGREYLDATITQEDFCIDDILITIKELSQNPKNKLQDFLDFPNIKVLPKVKVI